MNDTGQSVAQPQSGSGSHLDDASISPGVGQKTISDLIGGVARVAGLVTIVSVIAYYVGWREQRAYYGTLGCKWVVPLLSSADLIEVAAPTLISILAAAFARYENLLWGVIKRTTIPKIGFWAGMIGLVAGASLTLGIDNLIGVVAAHVVSLFGTVCLGIAAGTLITEVIIQLADSRSEWKVQHMSTAYLIVLFGFWSLPDDNGQLRAAQDGDPAISKLPIVRVIDQGGGKLAPGCSSRQATSPCATGHASRRPSLSDN